MPVTQSPGIVVYQDTIYDIRDGAVYQFLGLGKGWKALPGNGDMFQWAIGDSIYHFLNSKFLFRYMAPDKPFKELDHNLESKGIAASSRFVYQIEPKNGRVYQYNGRSWQILDSDRQAVAIAVDVDDTKLYQLHSNGAISQYIGSPGWQEIDSTPGVRTIVAEGGKLFKIHDDGSLYVHKVAYSWDRLDDSSDTIQVSAGAAGMYQRRGDGSVWRYSESGQKWDRIFEGNGQVMAITVGKQVYARKKDKSVVFFDGNEWHALI